MNPYPGVIVITGASGGIGSALTSYFLSQGMTHILCHYKSNEKDLFEILRKSDLDPAKHAFQADLTDEAQVDAFQKHAAKNFGRVWGLVNLVGSSSNGMSWKLTKSDFVTVVQASLLTTFLTSRAFLPGMRESNGGRIINTSSVVGSTGVAGASHYCAAKAAIVGFTKSVALEVTNKNITVNALGLGYYQYGLIDDIPETVLGEITARIPQKRLGSVEHIGGLIRYLLSDEGSYVTGQVMHVNGGLY